MKTTSFTTLAFSALTAFAAHAQGTTPATEAFSPGGYTATDGELLYQSFCAGCHMPEGQGAVGAGEYPALAANPNLEFASYTVHLIVNGQGGMPSLGHLLDDEQIVNLVSYLQTNLGNDYEPDVTAQMVADTRPESPEPEMAEHEVRSTEPAANGVVRHGLEGSDFPILMAVEVPADATMVYLSGTVPQVIDDTAEQGAPERFGNTQEQTVSTLAAIETRLNALDLGMGDVISMQVYLVAPEGSDAMDFGGFMEGYVQYFGTDAQPNLPTRSVFEVAGLANPSWLVEIEVVAVRP